MLQLMSIVAIIFLGANCQRRTDSFVYRVSFSFICLFGFIITSGLVAGFLSFRITDLIVRIAIGAVFLLLLLLNWRVINSRQQGSKLVRPTVTAMAILPTIFILGVSSLFFLRNSQYMGWHNKPRIRHGDEIFRTNQWFPTDQGGRRIPIWDALRG